MSGSGSSHRSSMHKVFIDGAAGTTGLEIAKRLADRAEFELLALDDAKRKDSAARREALNEADIAILCLPDDGTLGLRGNGLQ